MFLTSACPQVKNSIKERGISVPRACVCRQSSHSQAFKQVSGLQEIPSNNTSSSRHIPFSKTHNFLSRNVPLSKEHPFSSTRRFFNHVVTLCRKSSGNRRQSQSDLIEEEYPILFRRMQISLLSRLPLLNSKCSKHRAIRKLRECRLVGLHRAATMPQSIWSSVAVLLATPWHSNQMGEKGIFTPYAWTAVILSSMPLHLWYCLAKG